MQNWQEETFSERCNPRFCIRLVEEMILYRLCMSFHVKEKWCYWYWYWN